jgi:hypothetical protein
MSESSEEKARRARLRWISLGEAIAIAALVVSGLGLWHEWRRDDDSPATTTTVVEKRASIPLTLRAKATEDGRKLEISPVESSHALESLKITRRVAATIEVGSDGELNANDVESALKGHDKDPKDRTLSVPVRIDARYVEAGTDRRGGGSYALRYKWEGGGLFGGRSLRLVGLSKG